MDHAIGDEQIGLLESYAASSTEMYKISHLYGGFLLGPGYCHTQGPILSLSGAGADDDGDGDCDGDDDD